MSEFASNIQKEIIRLSQAEPAFDISVVGRYLKGPYKKGQYESKYLISESKRNITMMAIIYFKVSNVVTRINGRFAAVSILDLQYKTTLKRYIRALDASIADVLLLEGKEKLCEVRIVRKDWKEENPERELINLRNKILKLIKEQLNPAVLQKK